jgi:hypothetical protein
MRSIAMHLCDVAMEQKYLFSGFKPESVAIGIVIHARRTCKLDESIKHIEVMFGRSVQDEDI